MDRTVVGDFLDADKAWEEGDMEEKEYIKTIDNLRGFLNITRDCLAMIERDLK